MNIDAHDFNSPRGLAQINRLQPETIQNIFANDVFRGIMALHSIIDLDCRVCSIVSRNVSIFGFIRAFHPLQLAAIREC